jgi:hypothetical protein
MGEIFLDASIIWRSLEALDVAHVSLCFAPYSEQNTSAELDLFSVQHPHAFTRCRFGVKAF